MDTEIKHADGEGFKICPTSVRDDFFQILGYLEEGQDS